MGPSPNKASLLTQNSFPSRRFLFSERLLAQHTPPSQYDSVLFQTAHVSVLEVAQNEYPDWRGFRTAVSPLALSPASTDYRVYRTIPIISGRFCLVSLSISICSALHFVLKWLTSADLKHQNNALDIGYCTIIVHMRFFDPQFLKMTVAYPLILA